MTSAPSTSTAVPTGAPAAVVAALADVANAPAATVKIPLFEQVNAALATARAKLARRRINLDVLTDWVGEVLRSGPLTEATSANDVTKANTAAKIVGKWGSRRIDEVVQLTLTARRETAEARRQVLVSGPSWSSAMRYMPGERRRLAHHMLGQPVPGHAMPSYLNDMDKFLASAEKAVLEYDDGPSSAVVDSKG